MDMFYRDELSESDVTLLRDALALLQKYGMLRTSTLQRHLKVGYGRAAHIVDLFRELEIVGYPDESSYGAPALMSPEDAARRLEGFLNGEYQVTVVERTPPRRTKRRIESQLAEGVDPLLPYLALTVGVNGDLRLLDRDALQRQYAIPADRAEQLISVLLETGMIEPCTHPVYTATKNGESVRRLYAYMGLEMPAGEDVDCLQVALNCPAEDDGELSVEEFLSEFED